jgi:predicted phosphodiesterase
VGQHRLRIVHISDLHARGPRERDASRRERVLGAAWDENLAAIRSAGPVDLLCFTGDLAFSGKTDEYGGDPCPAASPFTVAEFLHRTLVGLGLERNQLFVAPGNHDVDRDVQKADWRSLRDLTRQLSHDEAELFSRWLAGGKPPHGFEPALRERLLARQGAYRSWVATHLRPSLLPTQRAAADGLPLGHPLLGYREPVRPSALPFDVHVIGLDSAWLAGDDDDARKLWLTDDQVLRLAGDERGRLLKGFRLALMHHPPGELADGERSEWLLSERVDLLLRGHLHEPEVRTVVDPQRAFRMAAAGCLYESDRYRNGMQIIDAVLDDAGRPLRYDLWFRSWSPQGHWHDDDGVYRSSSGGHVGWEMVPQPARPPRIHPRAGDVFVGRRDELLALRKALFPGQPERGPRPQP